MADERSGFGPEEPPPIDLGYLSLPEDVQRQAAAAASTCPFCRRIAAGEYDYHDEHDVAFQPLNPVTPGHFLVVPRKHTASALEPFAPVLLGGAMRLAAILARRMDLTDCNFINSAGPAATQSVPHLHVHVVPRREGDGLRLPWTGQGEDLVTVSREDLRAVLRVTPGSAWLAGTGYAAAMAARRRLTEALRAPDSLGHAEPYRDMAQDPGERTEALRAAEEFLP